MCGVPWTLDSRPTARLGPLSVASSFGEIMTRILRIVFALGCSLIAGCDSIDKAPPTAQTLHSAVESPGTASDPGFDPPDLEDGDATAGPRAVDINAALLASARKALPKEISTSELAGFLEAGLWNSNRTAVAISGCMEESVGRNGASQQQPGESVTRGDRRRRELEARSSSPPLARLLLRSLSASGGIWWSDVWG
jgi:hypothetical protein